MKLTVALKANAVCTLVGIVAAAVTDLRLATEPEVDDDVIIVHDDDAERVRLYLVAHYDVESVDDENDEVSLSEIAARGDWP